MKIRPIILSFCLLAGCPFNSIAQSVEILEKSLVGVFEVGGKTKQDIHSVINKWVTLNYNSAQHVIQMNDKESGTIIIKGINELTYKNTQKIVYPNNKYIEEFVTTKFNHILEFNIKDNKYRITYALVDIASQDFGFNNVLFEGVNLKGTTDASVANYNTVLSAGLQKGLMGQKKQTEFLTLTKPMFEEINGGLLESMQKTMKSIETFVASKAKDDW